ncbi:MAG: TonB family protein, partial [Deltaproteobacteria bacterium]|nr:TonB family protein [Deltaproteobacteria bacterium]
MRARRMLGDILASCLVHASLLAAAFVFSATPVEVPQAAVYRVSLVPAAMPALTAGAHYSPAAAPAAPEPAAATRQEKAADKAQASPKEKIISARKKQAAHPPPAEEASDPRAAAKAHAPAVEAGPAGGGAPQHIGGFAAYGEDAVDQPPSVAVQVTPEYPPRARRMGVEGRVEVRLVVDEAGRPQACAVHRAQPAGYFEEAALAA